MTLYNVYIHTLTGRNMALIRDLIINCSQAAEDIINQYSLNDIIEQYALSDHSVVKNLRIQLRSQTCDDYSSDNLTCIGFFTLFINAVNNYNNKKYLFSSVFDVNILRAELTKRKVSPDDSGIITDSLIISNHNRILKYLNANEINYYYNPYINKITLDAVSKNKLRRVLLESECSPVPKRYLDMVASLQKYQIDRDTNGIFYQYRIKNKLLTEERKRIASRLHSELCVLVQHLSGVELEKAVDGLITQAISTNDAAYKTMKRDRAYIWDAAGDLHEMLKEWKQEVTMGPGLTPLIIHPKKS